MSRQPLHTDTAAKAGGGAVNSASRSLAPAISFLGWFVGDGSLLAKALRFGLVGATSGVVFAVVTAALINLGGVNPTLSSVLAYIVSMPINFIANRNFSFRSTSHVATDAIRFCSLHAANLAITAVAMSSAVNSLGLHYSIGIIAAIVLVPLCNFLLLDRWVFGTRSRPAKC